MDTKENVEERLKRSKPLLKAKYGVSKIGVFGSYAKNEQTKKSDMDILVEFSDPIGWRFIDLKDELEKILGCKVDLATKDALKPQIKDTILQEVIYQ